MFMENLRQTAFKVRLSDVLSGKFIKQEGMKPSYVLSDSGQKIARVNIIGTVIDKFLSEDGNYSTLTVDDDTDAIRLKAFGEDVSKLEPFNAGDIVTVIGRVREYSDEIYILPEIVKKVDDANYILLRKLDILKGILKQKKTPKEEVAPTPAEADSEKSYKAIVLDTLNTNDTGEGVELKLLMSKSQLSEEVFEEAINELLSDGICFEPKPGVLKRV